MNDLKFQEETRQSKGRVDYIDLAKFFGIFCMVLCHSGMHNFLTQFIYAFHMPLFFFLSGYLFDRGKLRATVPYISKKFFSIMVPYAIFSLVLCFGKKGMTDWGYLLYASRDSIAQAESFTPLWFLPCFFLSSVIYFLISKFTSRNSLFYYGVIAFVAVVGFMLSSFRGRFLWGYPGNFDVALTGVALMGAGEVVKRLNFNNTAWGGYFCLSEAGCPFLTFQQV